MEDGLKVPIGSGAAVGLVAPTELADRRLPAGVEGAAKVEEHRRKPPLPGPGLSPIVAHRKPTSQAALRIATHSGREN
jgi:hypothetical protein